MLYNISENKMLFFLTEYCAISHVLPFEKYEL